MPFIEDHIANFSGTGGQFQRDALARMTGDNLFPPLLFRADVQRKQFEGTIGQSLTIPVPGLLPVDTRPRKSGVTPTPDVQPIEYYRVQPQPYGKSISVNMPGNYASAIGPYYQAKAKQVLQAGQTLNRIMRDRMFSTYLAGHAILDVVAGAGLVLTVSSLNGFATSIEASSGYPVPVSSASPKAFLRNGAAVPGSRIIGATPNDPTNPLGPGTLTLDVAAGFVATDRIDAVDASVILRPGGVTTVDGIGMADLFSLRLAQRAITRLRNNSVGPHADGFYHIHFPPDGEDALYQENAVQRQIETRGFEDDPFRKFAFGTGVGGLWYSNNECPRLGTIDTSRLVPSRPVTAPDAFCAGDIGADVVNATGISILRAIVTGGGIIQESYVDEMAYMTEAGYLGKIEARTVDNKGVEVRADGVRFIDQAPTDLFGEAVQMGWSYTGDFVPPTNRLSGLNSATSTPAYKLGVVIEAALPSGA